MSQSGDTLVVYPNIPTSPLYYALKGQDVDELLLLSEALEAGLICTVQD